MATTCLDSSQLALVIFGAIFGTLVLCVLFLLVLFFWARSRQWIKFNIPGLKGTPTHAVVKPKSNGVKGNSRLHLPPFTTSRIHPIMAKENKGTDEVDAEKGCAGEKDMSVNLRPTDKTSEVVEHTQTEQFDPEIIPVNECNVDPPISNGLAVLTSTPKIDPSTSVSSQPPSLPSGSPPSLVEGEEEDVCINGAIQPNSFASATNHEVVRLRQRPNTSSDVSMSPSSTSSIRMGLIKNDQGTTTNGVGMVGNYEPATILEQPQPTPTLKATQRDTKAPPKLPLPINGSACVDGVSSMDNASHIATEMANKNASETHLHESKSTQKDKPRDYNNTLSTHNPILSLEQCGTLEANRKRLETERQQLRQLGII